MEISCPNCSNKFETSAAAAVESHKKWTPRIMGNNPKLGHHGGPLGKIAVAISLLSAEMCYQGVRQLGEKSIYCPNCKAELRGIDLLLGKAKHAIS